MKKQITAITAAMAMLLGMLPMGASADADQIVVNDLYFHSIINGAEWKLDGPVDPENVTSVTIPAEIDGNPVMINTDVFTDCPNLEEILMDGENKYELHSEDGVLFRGTDMIAFPAAKSGDYTVPAGTTSILSFKNTTKLNKLTINDDVPELHSITIFSASITEFVSNIKNDNDYVIYNFCGCGNLRNISLDGNITDLQVVHMPELEDITFTKDAVHTGFTLINNCPKLKTLDLPVYGGVHTNNGSYLGNVDALLEIQSCDSLEHVKFYNGLLGMRQVNTSHTIIDGKKVEINIYKDTVSISECMNLKEIEISATPYVYSYDSISMRALPSLEKVTFYEQPKEALTGEATDSNYVPLKPEASCGKFTVYGRNTNTVLKSWCDYYNFAFEALNETGDMNEDGMINASDAAQVLQLSAIIGAGNTDDITENMRSIADVNADGRVNASDAAIILQYAAAVGAGNKDITLEDLIK